MLDTQKLLTACIKTAHLDEELQKFFLSRREGIIYGAGNQATLFYEYCKLLKKKIFCSVTTSKNTNARFHQTYPLDVYTLASLPSHIDISKFDIILCVNERNYRDIENAILHFFPDIHIYKVNSWTIENKKLSDCYKKFYNLLLKYERLRKKSHNFFNTKKKNLYIHLGMPKAGSTSLQGALFDNRHTLMNNNFYYPTPFSGLKAHYELISGMQPWTPIYRQGTPLFNIYHERMQNINCYNSILSCECFLYLLKSHFSLFLQYYSVYFIVIFRNPILWAQSYTVECSRAFFIFLMKYTFIQKEILTLCYNY